jgi:hypothetical protein
MTIPTAGSVSDFEWQRQTKQALDPVLAGKQNVISKSGAYTARSGDHVILCDATSAAFTITLPPANQYRGLGFTIKKTDSSVNAVTIDGHASEAIDGAATLALDAQHKARTLVSDGTGWQVVAAVG